MKTWTLILVGVVAVAFSARLFAEGAAPRKEAVRLTQAWGKVKSVDADAKTIVINGRMKRDEDAKDLTFAVTDATKFIVPGGEGGAGKAGTLADVKVDARVTILYGAAADGTLTALSVTVRAAETK